MANICINCKREIASGQKSCYLCGSTQSYFRYYLKSGLLLLVFIGAFGSASHWYIDKTLTAAEITKAQLAESKKELVNGQIEQIEIELNQLKNQLLESEAKIVKANEETNQLKAQLKETIKKLAEAEDKSIETDKKAGWLLKLNRQLKEELTALQSLTSEEKQPEVTSP